MTSLRMLKRETVRNLGNQTDVPKFTLSWGRGQGEGGLYQRSSNLSSVPERLFTHARNLYTPFPFPIIFSIRTCAL